LAVGYVAFGGEALGAYALGGNTGSLHEFSRIINDPYIPKWLAELISDVADAMR